MDILNVWILTRATGMASYLLVTISVLSGLYASIRRQRLQTPGWWSFLHQPLAYWSFFLALFHGLILLYDRYITFNWQDLLIPFASDYQTVPVGIGVLSLYGLLLTIIFSEIRSRIGNPLWKVMHAWSPVLYGLTTIHGLVLGTDRNIGIVIGLYLIPLFVVAILLIIRFVIPKRSGPRAIGNAKEVRDNAPVGS
jgi:DMSO/TMAO reductase YedYZ heme-binding membrane subunit